MNKVKAFPTTATKELVEIEQTEDFYAAAKTLSEFIKTLPLGTEDNDRLIALMVEQVRAAEQGAFLYGFKLGATFAAEQKKKRPTKS